MPTHRMRIGAEHLAYWYLRLNGFLTIPNFIVHPDQGRNQETDVDILGVRFPYRAELKTMQDDEPFIHARHKAFLVFAEVKAKMCSLNGPWTNSDRGNMQKVLRAVGALTAREIDIAAAALYKLGVYESGRYRVSLICLGSEPNPEVIKSYPMVPQITWSRTLPFIYQRFRAYRRQKESHGQWDENGRALWNMSERCGDAQEFVERVVVVG